MEGGLRDLFQSPQWGSNSKANKKASRKLAKAFQSPQWGSNSKERFAILKKKAHGFSPRNGEVILKNRWQCKNCFTLVSVPAMGK